MGILVEWMMSYMVGIHFDEFVKFFVGRLGNCGHLGVEDLVVIFLIKRVRLFYWSYIVFGLYFNLILIQKKCFHFMVFCCLRYYSTFSNLLNFSQLISPIFCDQFYSPFSAIFYSQACGLFQFYSYSRTCWKISLTNFSVIRDN